MHRMQSDGKTDKSLLMAEECFSKFPDPNGYLSSDMIRWAIYEWQQTRGVLVFGGFLLDSN